MTTQTSYTLSTTTPRGFEDAIARVRELLADEGFGVLCEIDVQATLKQKIGLEREPYVILGACNPPLAAHALETESDLGALLPCNVVVYVEDGTTHVSAINAERMLEIVENDDLTATSREVRDRFQRVIDRLDA